MLRDSLPRVPSHVDCMDCKGHFCLGLGARSVPDFLLEPILLAEDLLSYAEK